MHKTVVMSAAEYDNDAEANLADAIRGNGRDCRCGDGAD